MLFKCCFYYSPPCTELQHVRKSKACHDYCAQLRLLSYYWIAWIWTSVCSKRQINCEHLGDSFFPPTWTSTVPWARHPHPTHTHMELFQQSNTVSLLGLPAMKLYNSNVTVTQFLGSKGCFYLIKPAENKSLKYDRDFLLAISIYTLNQSSICQKSSLPNRNTHTQYFKQKLYIWEGFSAQECPA